MALFALLKSHGWKYCSLICCERKTLFVRWNSMTYNTSEQGQCSMQDRPAGYKNRESCSSLCQIDGRLIIVLDFSCELVMSLFLGVCVCVFVLSLVWCYFLETSWSRIFPLSKKNARYAYEVLCLDMHVSFEMVSHRYRGGIKQLASLKHQHSIPCQVVPGLSKILLPPFQIINRFNFFGLSILLCI